MPESTLGDLRWGPNKKRFATMPRIGSRTSARSSMKSALVAAGAVLIEVAAGAAHRDGIKFYRANESFWLADAVPARYLRRK